MALSPSPPRQSVAKGRGAGRVVAQGREVRSGAAAAATLAGSSTPHDTLPHLSCRYGKVTLLLGLLIVISSPIFWSLLNVVLLLW